MRIGKRQERARPWRLSAKLLIASSVATVIGFSAICANVMLDMDGKIGVVAPGAFADIIAVTGDPLRDIKILGNVDLVMKDGKLFRSGVQ